MEYFNEVVLMLTLYCMMCFGDLVPSVEQQVNMGWCCCLIVGGHFLINVFFMLRANFYSLKLRFKRYKLRKEQRRQK